MRRGGSLYWRTIAILAVMLGCAAAVLALAAWVYARRAANDAYDKLLIGAAFQMAESISVRDGAVDVDPPSAAFETLALAPDDRIFYKVTGPSGAILTGYPDLPSLENGAARGRPKPVVGDATYFDTPIRLALVERFLTDATPPGYARVLVAQTRGARTDLARDLATKALTILAIMMVLAFIGVLLAVRLALAPLRAIEDTLRARDQKDLSPLTVETAREIETLVGSINFFMARLSGRLTIMERFIADAAHQIRTPLTALASQVDMLAGGGHPDPRLERVRERTAELARLTNQLLNHAMVIHRVEAVSFAPIDLCDLARRVLTHAVPLSLDRDIALALEASPEAIVVLGDEVSLREALSNLLHNAIKYGARSRLEIEISALGTVAEIAVIDDGPGIPASRWEDVKQPFSGTGGSDQRSGSGLGLAIVNDVMRAHGGELSSERRGWGFAVVLRLPLSVRPS